MITNQSNHPIHWTSLTSPILNQKDEVLAEQSLSSLLSKKKQSLDSYSSQHFEKIFNQKIFHPQIEIELSELLESGQVEAANKSHEIYNALKVLLVWTKIQNKIEGNDSFDLKNISSLHDLLAKSKEFHDWFNDNIDNDPFLLKEILKSGALDSLPIDDYIKTNFYVIYKSELVDKLEDAEEFLFTENHINTENRKANGSLINKLTTKNSALFIESTPALLEITNTMKSRYCEMYHVKDTDNLSLLGWDSFLSISLSDEIYNVITKKTWEYQDLMVEAYDQKDFAIFQMLARKYLGLLSLRNSMLLATFPARTTSMIETLEGVEALRKIYFSGKIFLIAGTDHLQEPIRYNSQKTIPSENPLPNEQSLSRLYEKLKSRKVVILKSKFQEKINISCDLDYKQYEKSSFYSSKELFIDLKKIRKRLDRKKIYNLKTSEKNFKVPSKFSEIHFNENEIFYPMGTPIEEFTREDRS